MKTFLIKYFDSSREEMCEATVTTVGLASLFEVLRSTDWDDRIFMTVIELNPREARIRFFVQVTGNMN